ncbi:MAG TPA: hypothetical protein VGG03_03560 [Thermoanaerobaculia bacterium]|jgi:hypothetical protein
MKKGSVFAALCALALAAPATAERFYVPVLGTTAADGSALATKVWVANADGVERPVAAQFHDAVRVEGSERVVTARAGGQLLAGLAPAGKAGLIAIDADAALEISAWMVGRGGEGLVEVPVFTENEVYAAGTDVPLGDLPRPRAMASLLVGAANLATQAASCQATLFDRNGSLLAEIAFEVAPMSLAREEALAKAGRGQVDAVRVTCDQSFYPFAVAADEGGLVSVFAKGIGPNGACGFSLTLVKQANGHYTVGQAGLFHDATKANPKGIICIRTAEELRIGKAVYEWDVTVGPWSTRDRAGLHNLAYFFLDRYRSGVVGNINAAGPNKSFIKFMQNVGMPRYTNTNVKAGYEMKQGQTYHFIYTFDAHNKLATLQTFLGGVEVLRLSKEVKPGNGQALVVRPYAKASQVGGGLAMVAEFGNYVGQHHPEEASLFWKYSNFRVDMSPK